MSSVIGILVSVPNLHIYIYIYICNNVPDIAGVRMPSPIIIEVPIRTNSKRSVFKDDLFSNESFIFKALSNSGVGSLSRKLDICSSAVWRLGSILTFAYLQISEYSANVPPTIETINLLTVTCSTR